MKDGYIDMRGEDIIFSSPQVLEVLLRDLAESESSEDSRE